MRMSLIWINLIIAMGAMGFTNVVNAKDEYPLQMTATNDDIQLIKKIL
ncbi:ankyrin repeat domain-containing protein, partial [Acinetobacter baumannii]